MSEVPFSIPFSSTRAHQRQHTKSRLGCKVCKARKIKCDERRPVCGNCYKRFHNAAEECEFDHDPSQLGRSPGRSSASAKGSRINSPARSINTAPSFDSSPSGFAARSMELRLFHHFSTVTCLMLPTCEDPAGLKMWKVNIPCVAFEHSHIYSGILGISALHLLALRPDDVAIKAAAYQYIDETISAHREQLSSVESSNSLARFITSFLLTVLAKLRIRFEASNNTPYTLPINYFVLQNGAKDLWHQIPEIDSEVEAYMACYSHLAPPLRPVNPPEFDHHFYINQEFPYDPFISLVHSDSSIDPDRRSIYIRALDYITAVKDCILKRERPAWIRNRLGIAPSVLGPDFYILMQGSDPFVLLILARFFALFKFVDEPWWLQGTAEYEIKGLESLLSEEWKWGMQWPLEILEKSSQSVLEEGGMDTNEIKRDLPLSYWS